MRSIKTHHYYHIRIVVSFGWPSSAWCQAFAKSSTCAWSSNQGAADCVAFNLVSKWTSSQFDVDSTLIQCQFDVNLTSNRRRFDVDSTSIRHRFDGGRLAWGVDFGSIDTWAYDDDNDDNDDDDDDGGDGSDEDSGGGARWRPPRRRARARASR